MYYQLFIRNASFKEVQISCDSFDEVQQVVEQRQPKAARVEYYDERGLVGTAWKARSFKTGLYHTYKKVSNLNK
jgi:hypothetical protein